MADLKITELAELTTPGSSDPLSIVDDPAGTPVTKKVTVASLMTGWINDNATWTYASASTFTVAGDQTAIFTKGTKLKWTQASVKYGYVISSSYADPNTTVTIVVNTDYTIVTVVLGSA